MPHLSKRYGSCSTGAPPVIPADHGRDARVTLPQRLVSDACSGRRILPSLCYGAAFRALRARHRNNDCGSWYKDRPIAQILVLVTALNKLESLNRYVMTASSTATASVGHQATLNHVPPTSPVYFIDFFGARDRVLTETEGGTVQQSKIEQQIKRPAILRDRFAGLADVLEQGFYWLIWAGVLACLAFGIFGL